MVSKIKSLIKTEQVKDTAFRYILHGNALFIGVIFLALFITLFYQSSLSIKTFGFHFFVSDIWDPVSEQYGALVFIVGSLITSIVSLLISFPIALAIALMIIAKKSRMGSLLDWVIKISASIPSVVYGFWGLLVLVPLIRKVQLYFEWLPYGVGLLSAIIILTIMIIPFSVLLFKQILERLPKELEEASLSLGATYREMMVSVIYPYCKSSLNAAIILSFGRAVSETMAVTMVIGNVNKLPQSLISPTNSLASVLVNEFSEASQALHISSLYYLTLILFLITVLSVILSRFITKKIRVLR